MGTDEHDSWRPFDEARNFMRGLKLPNSVAYSDWSAAGLRPRDIPPSPNRVYEEWEGWADWLGNGGPRPRKLSKYADILPFEEARARVRELGLASQRAYFAWSKSEARPREIPANPAQAYRDEWKDWKDWLGLRLATLRPFMAAREFAWSLHLRTRREWVGQSQEADFPRDIPVYPDKIYGEGVWKGWGDWLGVYQEWNHLSIASFLDGLKGVIAELGEVDLYLILSRNGMLSRSHGLSNARLLRGLIGLRSAEDVELAKARVASSEGPGGEDLGDGEDERDSMSDDELELGQTTRLCTIRSLDQLRLVDRIVELRITDDLEVLEFLVENRVAALWQEFFNDNLEFTLDRVRGLDGGEYTGRIRDRFLEEYEAAAGLPLPDGYSFTRGGRPAQPNLMQRLTALRLLRQKRLGNWSGVGSGKTNAAILAAGVMGARLTLVLAANATVNDGWATSILGVFPDAAVHVKNAREFRPEPGRMNFLVVNYESFQQEWSEAFVRDLIDQNRVDFLVLDELQLARQRTAGKVSYRRELIEDLVARASVGNPELRVLGMSATPVVNNLHEAKKMLELVLGQELSDLPTSPTLGNAINLHMLLKRVGLRHRPNYDIEVVASTPFLDGMHLLDDLEKVAPGNVLALEQAVLPPKLEFLPSCLRRGTLIYTHYVTGIVDELVEVVEKAGLKPGLYTGDSKGGLAAFKSGEVDVLIASAPVGTGVDGLQDVCDRLVFISLPWTHAEYEQIVGRLVRQNPRFSRVEVVVPMVVLREDRAGLWSWDDLRKRCIEFKRTLADAALDGAVPLEKVMSRDEMQRRSVAALRDWIAQARDGIASAAPDTGAG